MKIIQTIVFAFFLLTGLGISAQKEDTTKTKDSLIFLSIKTDVLSLVEGDFTFFGAVKHKSFELELGVLLSHDNYKISQFEKYSDFDFLEKYERDFFNGFIDGYGFQINYNQYLQFFNTTNIAFFVGVGYKNKQLGGDFVYTIPAYYDLMGNYNFKSETKFSAHRAYNDFSAVVGIASVRYNIGFQLFGGVVYSKRTFDYPEVEVINKTVVVKNYDKSLDAITFKIGIKIFGGYSLKMSEILYGPE